VAGTAAQNRILHLSLIRPLRLFLNLPLSLQPVPDPDFCS
jgi:hypothetical protein